MTRGSRRCAAEPTPAARVTITRDRVPVPRGRGGVATMRCGRSSSWAAAIDAKPASVKRVRAHPRAEASYATLFQPRQDARRSGRGVQIVGFQGTGISR
jgi:hypothetical protein